MSFFTVFFVNLSSAFRPNLDGSIGGGRRDIARQRRVKSSAWNFARVLELFPRLIIMSSGKKKYSDSGEIF